MQTICKLNLVENFFDDNHMSNINLGKLKQITSEEEYNEIINGVIQHISADESEQLVMIKLREEQRNYTELMKMIVKSNALRIIHGQQQLKDSQSILNSSTVSTKNSWSIAEQYLAKFWASHSKKDYITSLEYYTQIINMEVISHVFAEYKRRQELGHMMDTFDKSNAYKYQLSRSTDPYIVRVYYNLVALHLKVLELWHQKLKVNTYSYSSLIKRLKRTLNIIQIFYDELKGLNVLAELRDLGFEDVCEEIDGFFLRLSAIR